MPVLFYASFSPVKEAPARVRARALYHCEDSWQETTTGMQLPGMKPLHSIFSILMSCQTS